MIIIELLPIFNCINTGVMNALGHLIAKHPYSDICTSR